MEGHYDTGKQESYVLDWWYFGSHHCCCCDTLGCRYLTTTAGTVRNAIGLRAHVQRSVTHARSPHVAAALSRVLDRQATKRKPPPVPASTLISRVEPLAPAPLPRLHELANPDTALRRLGGGFLVGVVE